MTETTDRAALIAEAKRMSLYVQRGGPDDGTVYDRLAVALAEAERDLAKAWDEGFRTAALGISAHHAAPNDAPDA